MTFVAPPAMKRRNKTGAVAPHVIHQHGEPGSLDRLHVHQRADAGIVGRHRVVGANQPRLHRSIKVHPLSARHGGRNLRLDGLQPGGIDGTAVGIAHLEAVVLGRVVAGRDIDRTQCIAFGDAKRDHWSRYAAATEMHRDAVGRQHLGRGRGEVLRSESLVAADHSATRQLPRISCLQIVSKTLRAAADVVEGVVLCNAGSPAIGTEDDVGHAVYSVMRQSFYYARDLRYPAGNVTRTA